MQYVTKNNFVSQFVCLSGCAFRSASIHRAETWWGGREWTPKVCGQFFEAIQPKAKGQPEVKLLRNALWSPNLVERTPDQNLMHSRSQRSCRVIWGQQGVQVAQECSKETKFERKNQRNLTLMKHSVLLGSQVMKGSAGVNHMLHCSGMPHTL